MHSDYVDTFDGFGSRDFIIKTFYGSEANYIEKMKKREAEYTAVVEACASVSFADYDDVVTVDIDDAVSALQSLGYKKKDADKAVSAAINNGATSVEDVIKISLGKMTGQEQGDAVSNEDVITDSVNGLLALGYKKRESEKIVKECYADGYNSVEEIIRVCLTKLK